MVLKLYYDFLSQPSRAIWLLLKKSGIEFEEVPISIINEEHKTDEIVKKNPHKAVPFIELDDGFILTESVAILKYIVSEYEAAARYCPSDAKQRARVDEYLSWQHFNTRGKCVKVFLNETFMKGHYDKEAVNVVDSMNEMLNRLELYFLTDKRFLTGDQVTIADLLATCELEQMVATGRKIFADNGNKKLQAWMERVRKEFSPYFDEAHKTIYDMAPKEKCTSK